jgi:N-methylhydantoinase A
MVSRQPTAHLRIGIDTGGTFTDIVCVDTASGALTVTKVPSTPANPALGLVSGVQKILGEVGATPGALIGLAHGTTVATNALLQGTISSLGLIVTDGFRHVLEIARQSVPDGYGNSYFWVKPDRAVPLHLVREVGGRLNFKGEELRLLDENSVREAARFFRARDIHAVGIPLMHAYANDRHEKRALEILREEYPECTVSISSQVLPEYREYERTITTLVDAFVKPHMERYLKRVKNALGPELQAKPFLVMQSNGGVMSAEQVVNKPITTALSGPAAGVLGSAVIAQLAGFENIVTLDAGGTSTDLSLIENGIAHVTNSGSVGPFPVRIPMIDIETIGTGGGSIAWISREGQLKVGPKSAGADPGPMCYPNGGDQPTITDANLVLGRLPSALIGGGIVLDVARSREGMAALSADLRAGMSVEEIAAGIIEIANWNQANRIRQMTIQRGIDPREFALLSFGGAGPVQSGAVAQLIGMKACIVPPSPGNLAAFGLLAVDWRNDQLVTKVMPEDKVDLDLVAELYAGLERDAVSRLKEDGIARERIRLVREADIRYIGQSMEVRVVAPGNAVDDSFIASLIGSFHAAHRRTFGYDYKGEQLTEIVNLRVSGFGLIERPSLPKLQRRQARAVSNGARNVWFDGSMRETKIYDRAALSVGAKLEGPVIVEEFGSTTVVFPGQQLTVDEHGILILRQSKAAYRVKR